MKAQKPNFLRGLVARGKMISRYFVKCVFTTEIVIPKDTSATKKLAQTKSTMEGHTRNKCFATSVNDATLLVDVISTLKARYTPIPVCARNAAPNVLAI